MDVLSRFIEDAVVRSLSHFPVVYLTGPRQSGKTTLVQRIANTRHKAQYVTFDDVLARSSAQSDPEAFLRGFSGPVVLDEVQMVPELFRPLKIIVDENRQKTNGGKGAFLLTGSASVMALPQLSDALVGRMVLHTLLPFSVQEQLGKKQASKATFIDKVFNEDWVYEKHSEHDLLEKMRKATFPEMAFLEESSLRTSWANGYINTILQRDVRVLLEIEKVGKLPDMLKLFASRPGSILNEASLAREVSLNHETAKRYRHLLENLYLISSIPAWTKNLGKRLIKSPKVYLTDTNLLAYCMNTELEEIQKTNAKFFGHILENFIATELLKEVTFSKISADLFHYRTASGQEVDFILEGPMNKIVGLEIKSRNKVVEKDFKHLMALKQDVGELFHSGCVFYQGREVLPFGDSLWALPISVLWS